MITADLAQPIVPGVHIRDDVIRPAVLLFVTDAGDIAKRGAYRRQGKLEALIWCCAATEDEGPPQST
eukprot:31316-Eustigmatos_ZCMA.PRE.1